MNTDFIPDTSLKIIQDRKSFSFGTDAILLTDFSPRADRVVDLGAGFGILFLRLMGLGKANFSIGVELDSAAAERAKDNITLNGLSDCAKIIVGDYTEVEKILQPECCDMVIANPPYFKNSLMGKHKTSRHEVTMTFEDLARAAAFVLKDRGIFVFSHTPKRLPELFSKVKKYRLEPKRMCFAEPKGKAAAIVLIETVKNGKEGMKMERTLLL